MALAFLKMNVKQRATKLEPNMNYIKHMIGVTHPVAASCGRSVVDGLILTMTGVLLEDVKNIQAR